MPIAPAPGKLAVTHVTTFYPPWSFGGDGVFVQRLAAAQVRRGHSVRVLHAPRAYKLLNGGDPSAGEADGVGADGVDVRGVPSGAGAIEAILVHQTGGPVLSRGWLRANLLQAAAEQTQVVHFHNVSLICGADGVDAVGAVRLFTAHEYWLTCATHMLFRYNRELCTRRTCLRCTLRSGRPPQWWRYSGKSARFLDRLDCMLFPSEASRHVYREHGIERDGELLPHFLPDDYAAAAEQHGQRRASADPYFLYVGRLDEVKGIGGLLATVAAEGLGAPLWVVGTGPDENRLRSQYADHPDIRFLGYCTNRQLGPVYRDAVALVMPAAGHEIFGQVIAEAFAHATPALASPLGGSAELVARSGAGYVVATPAELRSAAQRLLDDRTHRDDLGERGRAYVRSELAEGPIMARYEDIVLAQASRQ